MLHPDNTHSILIALTLAALAVAFYALGRRPTFPRVLVCTILSVWALTSAVTAFNLVASYPTIRGWPITEYTEFYSAQVIGSWGVTQERPLDGGCRPKSAYPRQIARPASDPTFAAIANALLQNPGQSVAYCPPREGEEGAEGRPNDEQVGQEGRPPPGMRTGRFSLHAVAGTSDKE